MEIRLITVEAIEPPRVQKEPNLPLHIKRTIEGSKRCISNGRILSTQPIKRR